VKCAFCFGESGSTKLSKEHLFSVPICRALGIDRTGLVASFNGNSGQVEHVAPLDERQVKLPCVSCNSGWMGQLENDTARTLQSWMAKSQNRLTSTGLTHVTRWLAKTAFVMGFAELGARQFLSGGVESVNPDFTIARLLANGETPNVTVGAARTVRSTTLWGAGNPSVFPVGPTRISSRSINVLGLNLGELQLWIAIPIFEPDELRLPPGVQQLNSSTKWRTLTSRKSNVDPTQVFAYFSDQTTDLLNAAMGLAQSGADVFNGNGMD
jgi:hypothetical protein